MLGKLPLSSVPRLVASSAVPGPAVPAAAAGSALIGAALVWQGWQGGAIAFGKLASSNIDPNSLVDLGLVLRVLAKIPHSALSIGAFLGNLLDVAELAPDPWVLVDRDYGMHLLSFNLAGVQSSLDHFGVHVGVGATWLTLAILISNVSRPARLAPAVTLETHDYCGVRAVEGDKLVSPRVLRDLGEGSGVASALSLVDLALSSRLAERQALRADLAFAPFISPVVPALGSGSIAWPVGLSHRTTC